MQYRSLILGDLDLKDERERPVPGPQDTAIEAVSDYVATVRGATKTVRVYDGEHAADVCFLSYVYPNVHPKDPLALSLQSVCAVISSVSVSRL